MNRRTDLWLIVATVMLVLFGLVMVYSASAVVSEDTLGSGLHFVVRQGIAVGVGLLFAVAVAVTPTRVLRKYRWGFYTAVILGLVLCLIPGVQHRANGAARWIGFGSFNLQPSEFAKLSVLLLLAHHLDRWRGRMADWRVLLQAALPVVLVVGLVMAEPDFGTTAIIVGLSVLIVFVGGARLKHLAAVGGSLLVAALPLVMLEPYRLRRVLSFLDPWKSAQGDGYHVIQSWIAMHSGGMTGQGLGASLAKLHFLPEPWTDFIGAVIAEELGMVGLLLMLVVYSIFVWRGLDIARRARDSFGMFLASSLSAMIGLEVFFNLAVVTGLVPPKGLVLPFISYGASAMISHLMAVGLLLSIGAETDTADASEGWPERRKPIPAALSLSR